MSADANLLSVFVLYDPETYYVVRLRPIYSGRLEFFGWTRNLDQMTMFDTKQEANDFLDKMDQMKQPRPKVIVRRLDYRIVEGEP